MPLPPAPTKRAALLSTDAFDAPARSLAKVARKMDVVEPTKKAPAMDLLDHQPAGGADQPLAYATNKPASPVIAGSESEKKERVPLPRPVSKLKKSRLTGPSKLFVLDTNVLMHDPMCLFRFE